jgi:hypothetical protein
MVRRSKKLEDFAAELKAQEPALIKRAGGKCEVRVPEACGKGFRMYHRHHKMMRSHGGTNDLDNLLWVCDGCHTYIHNHPAESYEKGWLLRGTNPPKPNGNGIAFPS